MRIIVATHNEGKLVEINRILEDCLSADAAQVELVSAGSLNLPDPVEDGVTFQENALLKARDVAARTGCPAIADDSGLMVDALSGAPGVYSARYGHKASDKERTAYLLENMKDVPEERRGAKFVCVITCLFPDGRKIVARGECPGVIARAPHGENGFGYDPVFYLPELGMTYAELPSEQKNAISHRARALQDFCRKYQEVQNHDK